MSAHAVPVLSEPQANTILEEAPTEVTIRFNEPIVPDLSQIAVLTQAGQDVGLEMQAVDEENRTLAVSLPSLNDGAYLVSWQVLSAVDGHTTSGSFSFGVGIAELTAVSEEITITAQISPINTTARWLNLTGIVLILGLFAFRLLIWNPTFAQVELDAEEEQLDQHHARLSLKFGFAGLVLIGLGLALVFIDQSLGYELLQGTNFQTWLGTRFGSMWLTRFFLVVGLYFHLNLFVKDKDTILKRGWVWWGGLALAIGLAMTTSLISHSAALARETWQATAVDLAHTLAAAVWAGGVLNLLLGLRLSRGLKATTRSWLNLNLNLNFSAVSALAVGILLVSGGYLAGKHVGSWTALVGTAYGLTLLAKVALAVVMLGIAAVNLLVIKPRLNRAYDTPETEQAVGIMRRFRRLVSAETVVAFLILVLAGVLTDLQRGLDAPLLADAPGQMVMNQTTEGVEAVLTVEPALVGQNSFDVYLEDENGNPITDASEVALRYTFLGQSIGSAVGTAVSQADGHYLLEGSYISLIGSWQVEISIRRPGAFDTFVPFRVEAGLGGNIRPLTSSARPLERFAKFMTIANTGATGLFMVLFAIGWGFLATRAAKTEWSLFPLLLISLFIFWMGTTNLLDFFGEEFTPAKFLTNPILPDTESVAIGQSLYEANCVSCHGETGGGDGLLAASLNPPPADFSSGHTDSHPDGDLYFWIRTGIEDTAMPAFEETFTRDEVWHLVNYVRRLSAQSLETTE